jgi:hypothetical protein
MREELEELSCERWCMMRGPTECWWEAAARGALTGTPHEDRVDRNMNRGYNSILSFLPRWHDRIDHERFTSSRHVVAIGIRD